MKITNRKKFIRSISITISIAIFIILFFINTSFSHTEVSYRKITISSGDTLWNLAKYEKRNNPYFEDYDVRDIIETIKASNNLKTSDLKIGDELIIPTV